jgi:isoleucyl-tRNA synthetase
MGVCARMKGTMDSSAPKKSFKDTLNLPSTTFPLRAQHADHDPALRARWETQRIDHKAMEKHRGKSKFVLHDGPPYANGHIHIGHALNKILKDMVTKSKRMAGYHAKFVPGWDCHGLPIELKVAAELGLDKTPEAIEPTSFKKACRAYARRSGKRIP